MRRWLCALLVGLACGGAALRAVAQPEPPRGLPLIADALAVALDDEPLWSVAADKPLPPASLTKIMTALLVIERGGLQARTTVSARAAGSSGSRLGLRKGEQIVVGELLGAALVRSANDACLALAEWHSGNEARFVARMNARAAQLDLRDTHFVNACGFDAPRHRSSAADLLKLAQAALARSEFADRVQWREGSLTTQGGRQLAYRSTNAMLDYYPGLLGVKTGRTTQAGDCLIVLAERKGHRVLAVLLNARDRWWDTTSLLDYVFAQFDDAGRPVPLAR